MKSNLVELEVELLHTTERAALVFHPDTEKKVWLPLSQCEVFPSDDGPNHIAFVPEWLAIEKELV